MDLTWLSHPDAMARLLATAFFAIVFVQSAADKILDPQGNQAFFGDHFKNSPLAGLVPLLFWSITLIEATAGVLCLIGLIRFDFADSGMSAASAGVTVSALALLCLLLGQRLAKDYAGAAVIAGYFAVALVGLLCFR